MISTIKNLKLKDIILADNSRYKTSNVAELMASIKEKGLLQPIGVTRDPKKAKYRLVYGNRRFAALRKLGLEEVPAVLLDKTIKDEKDFLLINLAENVQRENISPGEEGRIYYKLKKEFNMTNDEIAIRMGLTKNRVLNCLSIYAQIPTRWKNKIVHGNVVSKEKIRKEKLITADIAQQINKSIQRLRLKPKQQDLLYELASKGQILQRGVYTTARLLSAGVSPKEMPKIVENLQTKTITLQCNRAAIRKLEAKYKMSFTQVCTNVLKKNKDIGKCFLNL